MFWTVGGLYFSWTNIEEIRSEHIRITPNPVELPLPLFNEDISPVNFLPPQTKADMAKLRIVQVMGEAHYFLPFGSPDGENTSILVRFSDGRVRERLTESEAREIAKGALSIDLPIKSVEFIEKNGTSKHHEYRGKPLPAFAVNFGGPDSYTVYVSVDDRQVQAVRSNSWRVFDLLWMLHTMDFEGRDNINNYLLCCAHFRSLGS